MSKEVIGLTEIRNAAILKQTLEEMGIEYRELKSESFAWGTGYHKMSVSTKTGEVKYDSMYSTELNRLKQTYSKNFILAEIAKKGHRISSVNAVGNVIEITAGY